VQRARRIRLESCRQQSYDERREPEQHQRERRARHIAPDAPKSESDGAAREKAAGATPPHIAQPKKPAPSVRGHLRYGVQSHSFGQCEHGKQDAEQDHAARHPEDAGQEGARHHGGGESGNRRRYHGRSPRRSPSCEMLPYASNAFIFCIHMQKLDDPWISRSFVHS
jgi:hypothetical protein